MGFAKAGAHIIRQRGVRYSPGENMGLARDSTLFALKSGYVEFQKVWMPKKRHIVHIRERSPEAHMAFVHGKKPARRQRSGSTRIRMRSCRWAFLLTRGSRRGLSRTRRRCDYLVRDRCHKNVVVKSCGLACVYNISVVL